MLEENMDQYKNSQMERKQAVEHIVGSPLSMGDVFQDPQWLPESTDSIQLCICCFSLYIHSYDKV